MSAYRGGTVFIRKTKSAFTLVEILIVVIILGILAAIVIPRWAMRTNRPNTSWIFATT